MTNLENDELLGIEVDEAITIKRENMYGIYRNIIDGKDVFKCTINYPGTDRYHIEYYRKNRDKIKKKNAKRIMCLRCGKNISYGSLCVHIRSKRCSMLHQMKLNRGDYDESDECLGIDLDDLVIK